MLQKTNEFTVIPPGREQRIADVAGILGALNPSGQGWMALGVLCLHVFDVHDWLHLGTKEFQYLFGLNVLWIR